MIKRVSFFVTAVIATVFMTTSAMAVDDNIPIKWGKGVRSDHTYNIHVTNFAGKRMAGPYTRGNKREEIIGIRASTQQRRETKICIEPEGRALPLVSGYLVLNDGRGYPLAGSEDGIICTPDGVNVDSPDIAYLIVSTK